VTVTDNFVDQENEEEVVDERHQLMQRPLQQGSDIIPKLLERLKLTQPTTSQ